MSSMLMDSSTEPLSASFNSNTGGISTSDQLNEEHQITIQGASGNAVFSGFGNDLVSTDDGSDLINGGAGNDTISSGAGDDQ